MRMRQKATLSICDMHHLLIYISQSLSLNWRNTQKMKICACKFTFSNHAVTVHTVYRQKKHSILYDETKCLRCSCLRCCLKRKWINTISRIWWLSAPRDNEKKSARAPTHTHFVTIKKGFKLCVAYFTHSPTRLLSYFSDVSICVRLLHKFS